MICCRPPRFRQNPADVLDTPSIEFPRDPYPSKNVRFPPTVLSFTGAAAARRSWIAIAVLLVFVVAWFATLGGDVLLNPDEGRYATIALGMLRSGANIYFMAKMAIPRGTSVQDAGAQFQGITTAEFQAKLSAQAEGLIDKLKAREGYWIG